MKTGNVSASEVLNANILIVDEHDTNAIPLTRLLNNSGYRNVSFTDAFHDAIHLHHRFQYDLIVLNLQLPGMEEATLIDGLCKIEREGTVPILAIAGDSIEQFRTLPAGIKDFIRKPFDMLEVKTRIHNMLVIRFLSKKIENYNNTVETAVQERTAALKESEARFRSLIELSSDWYWEQDRHGNFTKTFGPVLEMLGMDEHCSANDSDVQRFHWQQSEREQLNFNIAEKRPFMDFSYRLIKPDGSHQYLRVSGEPIFDTSGCFSGYRGVGVDVSEHVRMEEQLARFQKLNGGADDAVLFLDSTDLHLRGANDAAVGLLGYTREELLALNFRKIVSRCQSNVHSIEGGLGGHKTQQKIDIVQIRHKNGSLFKAEMLYRHSKRTGEKNTSIAFVHRL